MSGIATYFTPGRVKKINLLCLLLAICWILFFPLKKEIWYDESVSVLISKGISHDSPADFANTASSTAEGVGQINTLGNVYHATIVDNGNSFLYNVILHWFTDIFGNSLPVYVLLSKLCAVGALIAFFFLCGLFFEGSIFVSLALLLFASDKIFWGMGHEIRAYEMGVLFVILAAHYCYKFLYKADQPVYLFLTGLFGVAAVLSHYLSVYVVLVIAGYLIANKKAGLFSRKNLLAILIPVAIIGAYFYFAFSGFQHMNSQNLAIKERKSGEVFSIAKAILMSMKFTDINFKVIFPALKDMTAITFASFVIVVGTYVAAIRMSKNSEDKRNLHLLFILGISSTIFLAMLSIKAQHYTALYARYYSFAVPFSALFIAYCLKVIFSNGGLNKVVAWSATAFIVLPCVYVYLMGVIRNNPELKYNHIVIAKAIVNDNVTELEVPDWNDAFLVNGFVPKGYTIKYTHNAGSNDFILHKATGVESIPVLRTDH